MIKYIIQKIISIVKKLDDAKDPFEAGNLVETREEIEYRTPPKLEIPPELIGEILSYIEDPVKIVKLTTINKTWYNEGKRLLYKDREKYFEWLRLYNINKLDPSIRHLKIDRLVVYIKIQKNLYKQSKKLFKKWYDAIEASDIAFHNLIDYFERIYPNIFYDYVNDKLILINDDLTIGLQYIDETHKELRLRYIEFLDKENLIENDYNIAVSQKKSFHNYTRNYLKFKIHILK